MKNTNREYGVFRLTVKSVLGIVLEPEYYFHPSRKWRFDFACPDMMLAIEVEGGVYTKGRHTSINGYKGDMEKYNEATILGWKVLRFTPDQLLTSKTLDTIRKAKKT